MAQLKIGKSIRATTTTKFGNKLNNRIGLIMYKRLAKAQARMENALKTLIEEAIKATPVYKGLDGQLTASGRGDLPAEFGLRDAEAKRAVEELMAILLSTVRVKMRYVIGPVTKTVINIEALNSEEYEPRLRSAGEPFSYTATNTYKVGGGREVTNENQIDWMIWLLDYSADIVERHIPNIKQYSIDYNLGPKRRRRSRSGRALMTQGRRRANWQPYVMPKIAVPRTRGSRNFIEDVALDKRFRQAIRRRLERIVFRAFNPGVALPNQG